MADRHPTKIVQIACDPSTSVSQGTIFGLDADGSLWMLRLGEWEHVVDSGALYAEHNRPATCARCGHREDEHATNGERVCLAEIGRAVDDTQSPRETTIFHCHECAGFLAGATA